MRTLKDIKRIKIILVILLVAMMCAVMTGVFWYKEIKAAYYGITEGKPACPSCGSTLTMYVEYIRDDGHYWYCELDTCDGVLTKVVTPHSLTYNNTSENKHQKICAISGCDYSQTENCTIEWVNIGETTHTERCKLSCGNEVTESHTYENGVCECGDTSACEHTGGEEHSSGGVCTNCGEVYIEHARENWGYCGNKTETTHTYYYGCTADGCGYTYTGSTVSHEFGGYTDKGDGTHSTTCQTASCDYVLTKEHIYENGVCVCGATEGCQHTAVHGENDGKCTKCGEVIHAISTNQTGWTYIVGEASHAPVYSCIAEGCDMTEPNYDLTEKCSGGESHDSGGECSTCGNVYLEHEYDYQNPVWVYVDASTCEYMFVCKVEGCTSTAGGEYVEHEAVHGENDGKCAKCGEVIHAISTNQTGWTYIVGEASHAPVYSCTAEGCDMTEPNYDLTEKCSGGESHDSGGECSTCGNEYIEHNKSEEKSYTNITETTHTYYYNCIAEGCGYTYESGTEEHTYENRMCVCGAKEPCEHNYETKTNEIQHWQECSLCGDKIQLENHSGATHENGGKCETCEYVYETHERTSELKGYIQTETSHTAVYKCAYQGCEETYAGNVEVHDGATHENGGKCETCEYVYETHGRSTAIKEYIKTETNHVAVYRCVHEGCEKTYAGSEEAHTINSWTDNEDGTHSGTCEICTYKKTKDHSYVEGICTDCGAEEPGQVCEHEYETKSDETNHWEECTKCNQRKVDSTEPHGYGEYTVNENGTHSRTCTECNYKETKVHILETKKDINGHWKRCTDCGYEEAKEEHEYEEYTNNGDGTHSSTCQECNYKLVETHDYENGECSKCGADEPVQVCEHEYETKSDKDGHWTKCKHCGETTTKESHTYEEYTDNGDGTHSSTCTKCRYKLTEAHKEGDECKYCGATDETTKPGDIPQTGATNIIMIVIAMLVAVLAVAGFKLKQYKDI